MLPFSKLVGTGNDFIFIDLRTTALAEKTSLSRERLAEVMCDRHFGIGADGIIFVEKANSLELLKWDFYNRDGSKAEFCGNAARCLGRWTLHNLKRDDFIFQSLIGNIRILAQKSKNEMRFVVQLHELQAAPTAISLKDPKLSSFHSALEHVKDVFLVQSGVPHFVCLTKSKLTREQNLQIVGAFRFHELSGLAGANVTFLFDGETESFERGVEDFTLSCGTGVIAAAICIWKTQRLMDVPLKTPGGQLRVEIVQAHGDTVTKVNLVGPAELICEGLYCLPNVSEPEKT